MWISVVPPHSSPTAVCHRDGLECRQVSRCRSRAEAEPAQRRATAWRAGCETERLMLRSCFNTSPKQLETVLPRESSSRYHSPDMCRDRGRRRPEWRHHRQVRRSTAESGAAACWRRTTTPQFWLCSAADGYCTSTVRHNLHIQWSVATVDMFQMVR